MISKPRYRAISVRVWNDEKFMKLSPDAKLLFLFVLTHPDMTNLGALRASREGITSELSIGYEEYAIRFTKAFTELYSEGSADGLLDYEQRGSLMVVPNYLKHNPPMNANMVKNMLNQLQNLPECPLLNRHLQRCYRILKGFNKGYSELFRKGLGERYSNTEPEPEPDNITTTTYVIPRMTEGAAEGSKEGDSQPSAPKPNGFVLTTALKQEVLDAWNQMAARSGVPGIGKWTDGRLRALKSRMADSDWRDSWKEALEKVPESDFLTGGGSQGWQIKIDFFLKPDTVTKILEGHYDGRGTKATDYADTDWENE